MEKPDRTPALRQGAPGPGGPDPRQGGRSQQTTHKGHQGSEGKNRGGSLPGASLSLLTRGSLKVKSPGLVGDKAGRGDHVQAGAGEHRPREDTVMKDFIYG